MDMAWHTAIQTRRDFGINLGTRICQDLDGLKSVKIREDRCPLRIHGSMGLVTKEHGSGGLSAIKQNGRFQVTYDRVGLWDRGLTTLIGLNFEGYPDLEE